MAPIALDTALPPLTSNELRLSDFRQLPQAATLGRQGAAGTIADLRYPAFRRCGRPALRGLEPATPGLSGPGGWMKHQAPSNSPDEFTSREMWTDTDARTLSRQAKCAATPASRSLGFKLSGLWSPTSASNHRPGFRQGSGLLGLPTRLDCVLHVIPLGGHFPFASDFASVRSGSGNTRPGFQL